MREKPDYSGGILIYGGAALMLYYLGLRAIIVMALMFAATCVVAGLVAWAWGLVRGRPYF